MKKIVTLLIVILGVRLMFFYLNSPIKTSQKAIHPQATIFTSIKQSIKSTYSQNLSAQNAGLLMGIVFGEKDMDKQSVKIFQKTGVLHIIAASGMNVSMLVSFLLAFLLIFLRRQQALVATFVAIIFYTALADFQPSIVRAAIMGGFAIGAGIIGRQNSAIFTLIITAFVMIFWDPAVLVSISFILSFAATAGIVLFEPIFKKYFKNPLLEDFRTTFAAQIATTPIILFFFGTYSPISILVNLLVLWTVPPLMLLGGIAAMFSFAPILSKPILLLCMPLLTYFMNVTGFFAQSAPQISIKETPWSLIGGYYLILIAILFYTYRRKSIVV